MNKRIKIGKTGIEASTLGLGAGVIGNSMMYPQVTEEMSRELLKAAIDENIDFIDTSYLYGMGRSEELIGEVFVANTYRHNIVLSTKAAANFSVNDKGAMQVDNSPSALRNSVEESLKRLGTDYIDLFFVHFPNSRTPLSEAAGALADLKREGKIRAIGASNLSMEQVKEFNADGNLDVIQTEYSLLAREPEKELIPYSLEQGISVIPIFPLASGLLTGKYKKEDTFTDLSRQSNPMFQKDAYIANLEKVEKWKSMAAKKGVTLPQLALAWLLTRPGVDLVIPGATRPAQLKSNLSTKNISLSDSELQLLNSSNS